MKEKELEHNQEIQMQMLENGMITADKFINKHYLIDAAKQEIVPLDESKKNIGTIRLFQLTKLIYSTSENMNDKLISVYNSLQDVEGAVLFVISGKKTRTDLYLGVRSAENAPTAGKILEKNFLGNFPGSKLETIKNREIAGILENMTISNYCSTQKSVSCVTVIPSMRDDNKEKFVQGIEKFIDTMQGEEYTALFIADPVSKKDMERKKRGFEGIFSELSPFAKVSLAYGENYSKAVTEGKFRNFSHAINNSISDTTGKNVSRSSSYTKGKNGGFHINDREFGINSGTTESTTNGYTSGEVWSKAVTTGSSDTTGEGDNQAETESSGDSRTLTVEYQNKSVEVLLNKVNEQLEQMKKCEAFGVWECAAYFMADDVQTSVVAANAYKALMVGDNTGVENSFVNIWGMEKQSSTGKVLEYLQYGQHPLMKVEPEDGYEPQIVTPGNFISGRELPLFLGLPHRSIAGLTVSSMAEFGRNIYIQNERQGGKKIRLGDIYHMGNLEKQEVSLDLESFSSHCFISGSTGSGKSNTVYNLLEHFIREKIPFLVVEPAKGEYKEAFAGVEGIHIFSTNPLIGQMLKLNPFHFNQNIHILEHLDRLIEIFNTCWEMYAAMPAILKDAVEQIYVEKGWDLLNSVYMKVGEPEFPTFNDLTRTLSKVISNSQYSVDTKSDYTGALVTRVRSLTNGISGQIFCDHYDIADHNLFDENVIVDLSRVGSVETKSLIMGLLVLKLSEYRMAEADSANHKLRHITVLEEAHNLLKRDMGGKFESNVARQSVEMICSSIAEMRTYGEGFIIVDQSPTSVDAAAIKNTNTKIFLRLPDKEDGEVAGSAAGLKEEQIRELSKLETGVAVVMQNDWFEAVQVKVDAASNRYCQKISNVLPGCMKKLKGQVIQELMSQYIEDKNMNLDRILSLIGCAEVPSYKKEEMRYSMTNVIHRLQRKRNIDFFCEVLWSLSGAKSIFDILEPNIIEAQQGAKYKYDVQSVKSWKRKFEKIILRYLELPDDFRDTLIKYLLYMKEQKDSAVNYQEVRRILDEDH